MIFIFLVCNFVSMVSSLSPTIDCFIDSKKCLINQNLVKTHVGVHTVEECSILCRDDSLCNAFTHFGPNTDFIANVCLLFSSCSQREPCKDCVTGTLQYECDCGIEYEGIVDPNNFVDLVPNIPAESSCKQLCARNEECAVYTYYDNKDSTRANICLLLTSTGFQPPITLCDHCKTGPVTCQTGQECQVAVIANTRNSSETQVLFLEESTTIDFVAGEKNCFHNITVLAIGGGGEKDSGASAGGGSGYIEIKNITLVNNEDNYIPVVVTVGASGESSSVMLEDEIVLQAWQGQITFGHDGGDGYSGGGGQGGDGGSDGGNGEDGDYAGGKGSGLNLEQISMQNFVFTSSEGGKTDSYGYGGGGGGVLVNGKSPNGNMQGFGGGQGSRWSEHANSGCVLIEF